MLHDGGRLAEVDDHAHVLAVPEDVDAVPVAVVEAVLRLDPQLKRPGAEVDEQPAIACYSILLGSSKKLAIMQLASFLSIT